MVFSISDITSGAGLAKENSASFKIFDWELEDKWTGITQADNDKAQESAIKSATVFILSRLGISMDASKLPDAATNKDLVSFIEGKTFAHKNPTQKAALIRAAFKTKLGSAITDDLRNAQQFKQRFLDKLMTS